MKGYTMHVMVKKAVLLVTFFGLSQVAATSLNEPFIVEEAFCQEFGDFALEDETPQLRQAYQEQEAAAHKPATVTQSLVRQAKMVTVSCFVAYCSLRQRLAQLFN